MYKAVCTENDLANHLKIETLVFRISITQIINNEKTLRTFKA